MKDLNQDLNPEPSKYEGVMLCSLVGVYLCLRGTYCIRIFRVEFEGDTVHLNAGNPL
jgi:hypothetical protein